MFRIASTACIATVIPAVLSAGHWIDLESNSLQTKGGERWEVGDVSDSRSMLLDEVGLLSELASLKSDNDVLALELPLPDGSRCEVEVVLSPIVEPGLQMWMDQNGMSIQTYSVRGINGHEDVTGRFDAGGLHGFHGRFTSDEGTWLIDPVYKGDKKTHRVYFRRSLENTQGFRCEVRTLFTRSAEGQSTRVQINQPGKRYELRLAAAVTGEFTNSFGGTVQDGLDGLIQGINKVNAVYERDMGTTFVLVSGTEQFIYTNGATDPLDDSDEAVMIDQNAPIFNNSIGLSAYDIGHSFGIGGFGGIADQGIVCRNNKANAATSTFDPQGDFYWIDIVAHEFGHQLSAGHTFSTVQGFCGSQGQYEWPSAYEPGSGSTILAYSGICGSDNINPSQNDPYAITIQQMTNYLGGQSCGTLFDTANNNKPTVDAGADKTIPPNTPFALTATSSDGDGDSVTYCWEQFDRAILPASIAEGDKGINPLFRSFFPTSSPTRYFPKIDSIFSASNSFAETLPTMGRNLTFRVTARDNNQAGGLTVFDDVVLNVNASLPSFEVSSASEGSSVERGEAVTVSWTTGGISGTAAEGSIRVAVLTNSELIPISDEVPFGNGEASAIIPNTIPLGNVRLAAMAANNYYFNVTDNFVTINAPTPPSFARVSVDVAEVAGNGNDIYGPGESYSFLPTISNSGGTANSPIITVSSMSPHVQIQNDTLTIPALANGESASAEAPVVVRFLSSLPCPGTVDLKFTVEDEVKGGAFDFTESLTIGGSSQAEFYREDFDAVPTPPYSVETISGTIDWEVSGGRIRHSGDSSARDGRLITSVLTKGDATILEFVHSYAFEPQADGAILEMRAFGNTNWEKVESTDFVSGEYNSVVGFNFPHPFGPSNAWTVIRSNVLSQVDISDFPDTFLLSFRLASTGGTPTTWNIDYIRLLGPGGVECDPVFVPQPGNYWILSEVEERKSDGREVSAVLR